MRHFILSGAVAAASLRMFEAALAARLVTSPSFALRVTARLVCAVPGAVDLATIAVAADEHLGLAANTQKESGSRFHRHVRLSRDVDEIRERWDTLSAFVLSTV